MHDNERFALFTERASPRASKTPTLDQMGIDLTARARQGEMAPVIGRDKDLERVIQVLSRNPMPRTEIRKNNVALISDLISEPERGIRKMAIIEGVAQLISSYRVPAVASVAEAQELSWLSYCLEKLQGKRLVTLDVGVLVAGTESQSALEWRFKEIIEEIRSSQDCIIFIDELPTLLGAGATEGTVDVAPLLVRALARGEMQCIGATTLDEYRTSIEQDPALHRRFQEVIVHEMIPEETTLNPSSSDSGTTRSKELMSDTQPHVRPALTLHSGQVPAFTADDMKAYLQGAPSCSLGPTLSGQPPTVESVEFATCKELRDRLQVYIGPVDDAPVCYVVLRGPFLAEMISYPPGAHHRPPFCETVEEIYDASTGRLLVTSAGSFKPRPGF